MSDKNDVDKALRDAFNACTEDAIKATKEKCEKVEEIAANYMVAALEAQSTDAYTKEQREFIKKIFKQALTVAAMSV